MNWLVYGLVRVSIVNDAVCLGCVLVSVRKYQSQNSTLSGYMFYISNGRSACTVRITQYKLLNQKIRLLRSFDTWRAARPATRHVTSQMTVILSNAALRTSDVAKSAFIILYPPYSLASEWFQVECGHAWSSPEIWSCKFMQVQQPRECLRVFFSESNIHDLKLEVL